MIQIINVYTSLMSKSQIFKIELYVSSSGSGAQSLIEVCYLFLVQSPSVDTTLNQYFFSLRCEDESTIIVIVVALSSAFQVSKDNQGEVVHQ